MFKRNRIKEKIANINHLKNNKVFEIVKKNLDDLDLMKLLEFQCPKDEYDFEVIDIVEFVIKTKDSKILTDFIIKVFNNAFDEDFNAQRKKIEETSRKILYEIRLLNPIKKETYFIPRDLLPGSCYFEFQPGKHAVNKGGTRLENSLYLYGDDDGNFNYSAIAPFALLISGSRPNPKEPHSFDYYGVTYIDVKSGKSMIENLRKFAKLLESGETIINALEKMNVYNRVAENKWLKKVMIEEGLLKEQIQIFDDNQRISLLDSVIIKNTAEELADWTELILAKYKWISILGI